MEIIVTSWDFILIQSINYTMAFSLLVFTWRYKRQYAFLMLAAILFGFISEYSAASKAVPPYHYTQALIFLLDTVPLGIVLSWGLIIFAVVHTARNLGLSPFYTALVAGLLAASLSFVTDPAFVSLGYWVWATPGGWFGVPLENYIGWYLFVASYTFMLEMGDPKRVIFPSSKNQLLPRLNALKEKSWYPAIMPFMMTIPAVFLAYTLLSLYYGIVGYGFASEASIVAAFYGIVLALIATQLPQMQHNHKPELHILIVPFFLLGTSGLILFLTDLSSKHPELSIVMPVLIIVLMTLFLSPCLNQLGKYKSKKSF